MQSVWGTGTKQCAVKPRIQYMKTQLLLFLSLPFLASCDVKVDNSDPPGKGTTIVTPGEKKTETNTTVVNPPAKEEKKVESNTTIINPPPNVEKKETTIINPPKP
jgi:hypothetical protein